MFILAGIILISIVAHINSRLKRIIKIKTIIKMSCITSIENSVTLKDALRYRNHFVEKYYYRERILDVS